MLSSKTPSAIRNPHSPISSTACSPPNATANAGAATGWTWRATRTAMVMKRIALGRMRGATATGSYARSMTTCPLISSPSSKSPAICCRRPRRSKSWPPRFIGRRSRTPKAARIRSNSASRPAWIAWRRSAPCGWASRSAARAATRTNTIRSRRRNTTSSSPSSTMATK